MLCTAFEMGLYAVCVGQRDTKQVDGVAHSVLVAQGMLASVWSTVLALQAAEITVDEPAWQLMAQLDIYGAASVLECLQVSPCCAVLCCAVLCCAVLLYS